MISFQVAICENVICSKHVFRRESSAVNDSDIIHPEPGYSSIQGASLDTVCGDYTQLQLENTSPLGVA